MQERVLDFTTDEALETALNHAIMPNFHAIIDRSGTHSLKWEKYAGEDILPMWLADMDFTSPECVVKALRDRVDHGVFGYTSGLDRRTRAERGRSLRILQGTRHRPFRWPPV